MWNSLVEGSDGFSGEEILPSSWPFHGKEKDQMTQAINLSETETLYPRSLVSWLSDRHQEDFHGVQVL